MKPLFPDYYHSISLVGATAENAKAYLVPCSAAQPGVHVEAISLVLGKAHGA
jgi:hypothetical protein